MKKIIIFLIIAPIISSILIITHLYFLVNESYDGAPVDFTISHGEHFSRINFRLHKEGVISNPRLFHYYTLYKSSMTKFKAGLYKIEPGDSISDIVEKFVSGTTLMTTITIPEGKNIFEIGKILENEGVLKYKEFIKLAKNTTLLDTFQIEGLERGPKRLEGYLYPDTYKFSPKTPPSIVIKSMVSQFKNKIASLDFSNTNLSMHEVITLASIVEKETGAKAERPIIAGVFLNRLKKRMRLQSDPTTIYGIYENFNGNLRKKDLLEKTEYNTYKISGLPIGPIANPGIDAIKSVLNPDRHNFYYFVSHNDGTHEFTSTYRDHIKAVEKYQKDRKNRAGKSWRNLKQD